MQIISRWPIDASKEGRDLSVNIRGRIGLLFPKGEFSNLQNTQVPAIEREIESLERIINNTHKKKFSRNAEGYSTASGLPIEALRQATSTEFLKALAQLHELSFIDKLKIRFGLKI